MRTYILRPRNAEPKPAATLKPIPTAKHADDAACPDAGWKPLSKEQKARLSMLARKAAEVQRVSGGYKAVDAWRHEISIRACGVRISEATQAHWADLKSAFEDLGGRPEKAFSTQMRAGDNKRRVAMWKLTQALNAKGLAPEYAGKICRAQFKCQLEEASAKQLWCLFYTVTNRRNS
jgi:hypothetical protein